MKHYYQPEIETASREAILKIQNEKIVRQVRYVWEHVPYYKKLMEERASCPTTSTAWTTSACCPS